MTAAQRPSACWRPYVAASPWNQQIDSSSPLDPQSGKVTAAIGTPSNVVAGWENTTRDYARPVYYSKPSDPIYTTVCSADYGDTCAVQGLQIAIPSGAKPARGGDGHLTVIDPITMWEYDFWQVTSKPPGGGTLQASWGGHAIVDAFGIGTDRVGAVAWGGPTAAGLLRAEEIEAGAVNHALLMIVPCTNGEPVFPARHDGQECPPSRRADAPAMGARFRLNMTDAQIDAIHPLPAWKKTILEAMAHYGMIVGDTGGDENGWGVQWESGIEYTSLGRPNEWIRLAQSSGIKRNTDGAYVFNLRDGVNWAKYLQVVAPCASSETCNGQTVRVASASGIPGSVVGIGVSDGAATAEELSQDQATTISAGQCGRALPAANRAKSARLKQRILAQYAQCQKETQRFLGMHG